MHTILLLPVLNTASHDSIPRTNGEPLRNPSLLLGIWAAVGEENAPDDTQVFYRMKRNK